MTTLWLTIINSISKLARKESVSSPLRSIKWSHSFLHLLIPCSHSHCIYSSLSFYNCPRSHCVWIIASTERSYTRAPSSFSTYITYFELLAPPKRRMPHLKETAKPSGSLIQFNYWEGAFSTLGPTLFLSSRSNSSNPTQSFHRSIKLILIWEQCFQVFGVRRWEEGALPTSLSW